MNVVRGGRYRFELYRGPKHLKQASGCVHARLAVGGKEWSSDADPAQAAAVFEADLPAGPTRVETWLRPAEGKEHGAYFVWVTRL